MHLILILASLLSSEPASTPTREAKLDAAVTSLWTALSHGEGGGADRATLVKLFHPEARVYGVRGDALRLRSAAEFIDLVAEPAPEGFFEREIFRSVDATGAFAQVLCTVESRETAASTKPLVTGINSLHLYWNGSEWQILTLYYSIESERERIPDKYRRH